MKATEIKISNQKGFVLTLELILITTILILGTIVGIVAVRDALIKYKASQQDREIVVVDSNSQVLGPAINFDEHEAPLIPYIDRSVPPLYPDPLHRNYRALLGVRDDRFTSREPVYYEGANCTGRPCIKSTSDETSDSRGVDLLPHTGAVSYFHALQGGPNYAIGMSADGIRGSLMRSSGAFCPVEPSALQSRYLSQKVVSGSPCEAFSLEKVQADSSCLVSVDVKGNAFGGLGEPGVACEVCPAGTESQGDVLDNYLPQVEFLLDNALKTLRLAGLTPTVKLTIGDICCPLGSKLSEDENLVEALVFTILENVFELLGIQLLENPLIIDTLSLLGIEEGIVHCVPSIKLEMAEYVPNANDPNANALDYFTPPFRVNLPSNSGLNSEQWIYTPPRGEGNFN